MLLYRSSRVSGLKPRAALDGIVPFPLPGRRRRSSATGAAGAGFRAFSAGHAAGVRLGQLRLDAYSLDKSSSPPRRWMATLNSPDLYPKDWRKEGLQLAAWGHLWLAPTLRRINSRGEIMQSS